MYLTARIFPIWLDGGDVLVDITHVSECVDSFVDHIFDGNDDDRASFGLMIVPNRGAVFVEEGYL